jgi:cell division protein ftsQ
LAQKQKYKLLDGGKSEKSRKKSASGKKKKKSSGKAAGYFYAVATPGEWLRANLGVLIASIAIVCLAAIALVVVSVFRVQNISVEGNVHYTSEEIEAMVLTDRLSYNSLYLSLKYRNKEIRDIPFIETMSVRVDSPDSITIRVYEKSVAGYVEYMGRYMYFDRDGIVVESSETRTEGIPQVTGIRFDHVVLYETLPVKNTDIFQEILSITQMLSKHQITTDKIYFNESNEITLYFDNIRAKLGKDNLEEKVMRLEQILPNLSGESGVLDLQNYSEDRKNVTFQKDG